MYLEFVSWNPLKIPHNPTSPSDSPVITSNEGALLVTTVNGTLNPKRAKGYHYLEIHGCLVRLLITYFEDLGGL